MNTHTIEEKPSKIERLFLHFFDTHFIADKGAAAQSANFQREIRLATRIAVASAHAVYIPAASYFESPICRDILNELDELVGYGFIVLSGSAPNLEEYLRERQDESFYRKGSQQYDWYRALHNSHTALPYEQRRRSATRDVTLHWTQSVENETLIRKVRDAVDSLPPTLEKRIERVPQELGGLAFIPDHVYEVLDLHNAPPLVRARIRGVINEGYFESYVKDLTAGVMVDLKYLASDFQVPSYGRNLSYIKMLRFLQTNNRLQEFANCPPSQLMSIGNENDWQIALQACSSHASGRSSFDELASLILTFQSRYMTNTNPTGPNMQTPSETQASVLCVAAAQVEFEMARRRLETEFGEEKIVYIDDRRTKYALKFTDSSTATDWFLAGLTFQGEVEAAQAVGNMRHLLKPDIIVMVGMCMGMPSRQFPVGTVIVPNEVFGFDHRRLTNSGEQFRLHSASADTGLYQIARIMSGRQQEYKVISDKGLASSSVKIESTDNSLIAHIETAFPDAAAFDMEGFGFYRALEGAHCLWVKGVADSGESQQSSSAGRDQKQATQSDATGNAVDFMLKVVRSWSTSKPVR